MNNDTLAQINRLEDKKHKKSVQLLLFGIVMQVVAAGVRKYIPGQPNFIEPITSAIVTIYLIKNTKRPFNRRIPKWLSEPILIFVFLEALYMLPSLYVDYRVSALAFFTRILPIGMFVVAYRVTRDTNVYIPSVKFLLWFSCALLPVTILFLIGGNSFLPKLFQPISAYSETGRDFRNGIEMYSAIFPTPSILANTMMVSTYFILSRVPYCKNFKRERLYWFGAISSLFIAYVSGRRGAFYMSMLAFTVAFILKGINKKWVILISVVGAMTFYFTDNMSVPKEVKNAYGSRSELMTDLDVKNRISNIFFGLTIRWAKVYPFGTFLGFGAREGQMFGVQPEKFAVDVGAAMLVIETGIFGLLLFPFVLTILWVRIYRKSVRLQCGSTIKMLLSFHVAYFVLFYAKEISCLTSPSIAQILFWSTPGICAGLIKTELAENKSKSGKGFYDENSIYYRLSE